MYNGLGLWQHSGTNAVQRAVALCCGRRDRTSFARESMGDVTMASYQERRQTIRIATNGQLNVECVRQGPALRLVDVGTGGFCALALASIPIGTVANYRFTTPDRKWMAVFHAKTVYCRPEIQEGRSTGHFVVGFSFLTGQPSVMQQIMAMIDVATGFVTYS